LLVIEVSSGEYGDFLEKMVTAVENGHFSFPQQQASAGDMYSKNEKSTRVTPG
jgi:hypothetical protein